MDKIQAPYRVGDFMDPDVVETVVQSVENLAPNVWFIGVDGTGFIYMSPEATGKIPELWRNAAPIYGGDGMPGLNGICLAGVGKRREAVENGFLSPTLKTTKSLRRPLARHES